MYASKHAMQTDEHTTHAGTASTRMACMPHHVDEFAQLPELPRSGWRHVLLGISMGKPVQCIGNVIGHTQLNVCSVGFTHAPLCVTRITVVIVADVLSIPLCFVCPVCHGYIGAAVCCDVVCLARGRARRCTLCILVCSAWCAAVLCTAVLCAAVLCAAAQRLPPVVQRSAPDWVRVKHRDEFVHLHAQHSKVLCGVVQVIAWRGMHRHSVHATTGTGMMLIYVVHT